MVAELEVRKSIDSPWISRTWIGHPEPGQAPWIGFVHN